jgi:hypothetical protein
MGPGVGAPADRKMTLLTLARLIVQFMLRNL